MRRASTGLRDEKRVLTTCLVMKHFTVLTEALNIIGDSKIVEWFSLCFSFKPYSATYSQIPQTLPKEIFVICESNLM